MNLEITNSDRKVLPKLPEMKTGLIIAARKLNVRIKDLLPMIPSINTNVLLIRKVNLQSEDDQGRELSDRDRSKGHRQKRSLEGVPPQENIVKVNTTADIPSMIRVPLGGSLANIKPSIMSNIKGLYSRSLCSNSPIKKHTSTVSVDRKIKHFNIKKIRIKDQSPSRDVDASPAKIIQIISPKPGLPQAASAKLVKIKEKSFTYIIKPGNNSDLIKSMFSNRQNWKEVTAVYSCNYNFKWQANKKGMEYCLLNKAQANVKVILNFKTEMVNHFEFDPEISNKKFLFLNLLEYCDRNNLDVFSFVPFTLVVNMNCNSFKENFDNFGALFNSMQSLTEKSGALYTDLFTNENFSYKTLSSPISFPKTHYSGKNLWLIKPTDLYGGKCIKISDNVEDIERLLKKFSDGMDKSVKKSIEEEAGESEGESTADSKTKIKKAKYRASTVLLQKYIEMPFLYKGRKFDIRMWILISHKLDVYLFKEGHLKTTSTEYRTDTKDKFVHITNYSLQKYNKNFNKYEEGNEVPFKDFQDLLDTTHPGVTISKDILPQMKEIIKHTTASVKHKINRKNRQHCYVVLGYDFMIDVDLKVWLIEVNKNPGLSESSPIIKVLLPRMLDDSFRLTLDDVFPPSYINNESDNYKSPYPVTDYDDYENMWEFVHSIGER